VPVNVVKVAKFHLPLKAQRLCLVLLGLFEEVLSQMPPYYRKELRFPPPLRLSADRLNGTAQLPKPRL
jgi:hypothetical protein